MTSYDVGDTASLTLHVAPSAGSTAAAIQVTNPLGVVTTPTALGGPADWTASVPLTVAGTWTVQWTVTGTGAGVEYDTLVAETPPPVSTAVRQVRLLIADTDPTRRIFPVSDVLDFLTLEGQSTRLAAAQALDVIASSEVLVSKKIRTQDLSTDGPAVAAELRARASELRRQVAAGAGTGDVQVGPALPVWDFPDPAIVTDSLGWW